MNETAPLINVQQIGGRRDTKPGSWIIEWYIHNLGEEPLTLLSAQLPHGKFKSDPVEFAGGLRLPARAKARIEASVVCDEAPGAIIDNAFLILRTEWRQAEWRIFVRFQVRVNQEGEPWTQTELITTQRVGFSKGSAETERH